MIQAAVVPCVLIFGGTTITGILMGIVPGWLISPMGLANYAFVSATSTAHHGFPADKA